LYDGQKKEAHMSEQSLIQETPTPRTRESLAHDLRALGVEAGMTLEVHSSLSKLGWVCGGPVAVVQALMDVVTETGTLVMPTHSSNYTDPAKWNNPPVPQSWWLMLYEQMPAFDPRITPSWFMGQVVETFRTWPGVLRSSHPAVSFAAWGRYAQTITANHSLDNGLGEHSPLARLYDLDGYVLLLGVSYESCTSLHLAEYRSPHPKLLTEGSPILENGRRVWKTYQDIELDSDQFPEIGAAFEETSLVKTCPVGSAQCKLLPQRPAVDFATEWLTRKRTRSE
jgi:aminoglycoside 3-N-acetyltransferase